MLDLAVQPDIALPEYPRLRTGCCVFEHEGTLVVRTTRAAFRIEPAHRNTMERVLSRLDGRNDLETCLGKERSDDAFYALRMLVWFAESGILQEGFAALETAAYPSNAIDGITVAIIGQGALSRAVVRALRDLGAVCNAVSGIADVAPELVAVVCSDTPDLGRLETLNAQACRLSVRWFPVFGFGDAVVAGPLLRKGQVCFRCFELRWLGLSPAIALERACWTWFRDRKQMADPVLQAVAEPIARLAAAGLARAIFEDVQPHQSAALAQLIDLDRLRAEPMPVLQHPSCRWCKAEQADPGDAAWSRTALAQPALALFTLAGRLRPLRTGRAALACLPPPRPELEPPGPLYIAYARFGEPAPADSGPVQNTWCQGSGECRAEAETIATVEALERYAGLLSARVERCAPFTAVAQQALDPRRLPLFSQAQYARPGCRFQPFDPEREQGWSRGYNLTRDESVLVLSDAAWYGADSGLLAGTSSGVAAHSSRAEALLNAALELIERDAFMIFWLHGLSPPLVDLDALPGSATKSLLRYVHGRGYTLSVADISTDLNVPVCLALARRFDKKGPALVVGAGASLHPAAAAERALREVAAALSTQTPLWTLPAALAPDDVKTMLDHGKAYEHPDWLPHAEFLWSSDRIASLDEGLGPRSGQTALEALVRQLASCGHELIGIDLTPSDVAAAGLVVVRAIAPGLQPLDFGDAIRLGGDRLYDAPIRMGYYRARVSESSLNPVPHCFP